MFPAIRIHRHTVGNRSRLDWTRTTLPVLWGRARSCWRFCCSDSLEAVGGGVGSQHALTLALLGLVQRVGVLASVLPQLRPHRVSALMKPADTHRTAFTSVTQIRIKLDYKRRARRRLWTRAVVAMKTLWSVTRSGRWWTADCSSLKTFQVSALPVSYFLK